MPEACTVDWRERYPGDSPIAGMRLGLGGGGGSGGGAVQSNPLRQEVGAEAFKVYKRRRSHARPELHRRED